MSDKQNTNNIEKDQNKKGNKVTKEATLNFISKKYDLNLSSRSPIEIPNVGRNQLPELFNELGYKKGAEIGVAEGVYSEILCNAIPDLELFCVDPWSIYDGYHVHDKQKIMEMQYKNAKRRLSSYNTRLIRKSSMEAIKSFKDASLDFVYIDGNHYYEYVVQDIGFWVRKIKKGGIIAGHDYIRKRGPTKSHVIQAVNGYVDSYGISPWFLIGRQAKVPGEIRDSTRSWMWVV